MSHEKFMAADKILVCRHKEEFIRDVGLATDINGRGFDFSDLIPTEYPVIIGITDLVGNWQVEVLASPALLDLIFTPKDDMSVILGEWSGLGAGMPHQALATELAYKGLVENKVIIKPFLERLNNNAGTLVTYNRGYHANSRVRWSDIFREYNVPATLIEKVEFFTVALNPGKLSAALYDIKDLHYATIYWNLSELEVGDPLPKPIIIEK